MKTNAEKRRRADFLRLVREKINSFDYDFSDPADFMKDVIGIAYPGRKSPRAAKILREFGLGEDPE